MNKLVVQGAALKCSMGLAPASFAVVAPHSISGGDMRAGTIDDYVPNANIPPFGMCTSMQNPQVQAATAAALGVLTPQPCLPVVPQAWTPGSSSVEVAARPALHDGCTCQCQWGGGISITDPGQEDVEVD